MSEYKRPGTLAGETDKLTTGCGNLYVTLNKDKGGIKECFCVLGRSGGCPAAQTEAIGRLISLMLKEGVSRKEIAQQLRGIRCHSPHTEEGTEVLSCADAIGIAMARRSGMAVQVEKEMTSEKKDIEPSRGACPDCGSAVVYQEGCLKCMCCGYSECG